MNENTDDLDVLVFEMANEGKNQKFGLNIFKVQEILTYKDCTRLVNTPPEVTGVIQSREELITLLDLSMVLFGKKTELTKDSLIVICHSSNKKIGLLVSSVSNIVNTKWSNIKNVDDITNDSSYLVNGILNFENSLISIINLEGLMTKIFGVAKENTNKITRKDLSKINVLVIDDSKWSQNLIGSVLKKENINYSQALDGQDGLEKVKSKDINFNIILCDIEMPKMNGYSFLEEMNNFKKAGNKIPPIIMYSSLCDNVSIEKAKNLGATHYITKYDVDKLLRSIEDFV